MPHSPQHFPPMTASAGFRDLQAHYADAAKWRMLDLFAADPERFSRFSLEAAGLFLDYSKNLINEQTMRLLMQLAHERGLPQKRDAMFSGEKINVTEHRPVLHIALRLPRTASLIVNGQDVVPEVHAVLDRIAAFSESVRSGAWRGCSGKEITDIVNIGIGGSDLGPEMAYKALRAYAHPRMHYHFVSNVDGHHLASILKKVQPETTLFIVASKTFTTRETMLNARSARNWFLQHGHSEQDLRRHFVAVSTNTRAVREFGIDPDNMFPFWDWVGGRYSIWSAIGLPLAIAVGGERFAEFLAGGHAMDRHFLEAPLERNMPVILGMLGIWYRNFFGYNAISIAPYHQYLNRFTAYLQQLDMESNGKRTTIDGQPVQSGTGPVVWGDVGCNGQHAYFQLLHEGTDVIPVDFIASLKPAHNLPCHQVTLLANCFAQAEALMRGKNADEVRADLRAQGVPDEDIEEVLPHRIMPGNRPSNMILMDELTPAALGALLALYEHKVFVQGAVWGINSFDQWGVELGKVLAKNIEPELEGAATHVHDSSTSGLIARARAALSRKE